MTSNYQLRKALYKQIKSKDLTVNIAADEFFRLVKLDDDTFLLNIDIQTDKGNITIKGLTKNNFNSYNTTSDIELSVDTGNIVYVKNTSADTTTITSTSIELVKGILNESYFDKVETDPEAGVIFNSKTDTAVNAVVGSSSRINSAVSSFSDRLYVHGPSVLNYTLEVNGLTTLHNKTDIVGPLEVTEATTLNGSLSVTGVNNTISLAGPTIISNDLTVSGETELLDSLTVTGNKPTNLGGTLTVSGETELLDSLTVNGNSTLGDSISRTNLIRGNTTINGNTSEKLLTLQSDGTTRWTVESDGVLESVGAQTIRTTTGDLTLTSLDGNGNINLTPNGTGIVNISKGTTISGKANLNSLEVENNSLFKGDVDIKGTLNVDSAVTLGDTLGVAGDLSVGAGKFNIDTSTGNTDISGNLEVSGNSSSDTFTSTTITSAPFSLLSTILVNNLNADLLDGQHGSYYITADNLIGTIPSDVLGNSTLYVGTTGIKLNRSSAVQTLSGVSIDGNAATATALATPINIFGQSFNGTDNVTGNISDVGTITFGTGTNKATLTYTTDTARTLTVPNTGADADFVMTEGNQTIAGIKTFTSSPVVPAPTGVTSAVNKEYVDGLISGVYRPSGNWDANTNTPTLTNNVSANTGKVYRVTTAGTQFGLTFAVGDKLAFIEGGAATKWDNVDDVTSVAGKTGNVTLNKGDVGLSNVANVLQLTASNKGETVGKTLTFGGTFKVLQTLADGTVNERTMTMPTNPNVNNYLTGISGSANGTATFTREGLGNLTWTTSHDHTISQITGLQGELDDKQPLDADLTSIAALTGTSGLLRKTTTNTWSLDNTVYENSANRVNTIRPSSTATDSNYPSEKAVAIRLDNIDDLLDDISGEGGDLGSLNNRITNLEDGKESLSNKRTDIRNSGANNTSYVSELGIKNYVDERISGVYRPSGNWDANTNTPTLTNNVSANTGKVYRVTTAGTQFGLTFAVGDKLAFIEGGAATKWDNVDDVTSVAGKTGNVTLDKGDVGLANVANVLQLTASNKGETDNKTLTFGGTFKVLQTLADGTVNERTMTMPAETTYSNMVAADITNSTTNSRVITGVFLKGYLDSKVTSNTAITGSTKTKIKYDSKGLVTGGADLVESDIPALSPSKITQDTNNRFVTDAEKSTWNNKSDYDDSKITDYVYTSDILLLDGLNLANNVDLQNVVDTLHPEEIITMSNIKIGHGMRLRISRPNGGYTEYGVATIIGLNEDETAIEIIVKKFSGSLLNSQSQFLVIGTIIKHPDYPSNVYVNTTAGNFSLSNFEAALAANVIRPLLTNLVEADIPSLAISKITNLQTTLDGKEPAITAGTTAQYWRGDKTWQTLPTAPPTNLRTTYSATSVTITSSTGNNATIDGATDEAAGVLTTGEQTIAGTKTFNNNVSVKGDLTVEGDINVNNVNVIETSNGIIFEGTPTDDYVTTLKAKDPTSNRIIELPNSSGTVALIENLPEGKSIKIEGSSLVWDSASESLKFVFT